MKKIIYTFLSITFLSYAAGQGTDVGYTANIVNLADGVNIAATTENIQLGQILRAAGITPSQTGTTDITLSGTQNKTATVRFPLNYDLTGNGNTLTMVTSITGEANGTAAVSGTNNTFTTTSSLGDGAVETPANNGTFTLNTAFVNALTGTETLGVVNGVIPLTAFWN